MKNKFIGLDEEALPKNLRDQIEDLSEIPILVSNLFFPDLHFGYTFPIGTLSEATKDGILPLAVGVDIFCGVRFEEIQGLEVKKFMQKRKEIGKLLQSELKVSPFSFLEDYLGNEKFYSYEDMYSIICRENEKEKIFLPHLVLDPSSPKKKHWRELPFVGQLGTLGGGNHFLEISSQGNKLYFSAHSGSRGFGASVFRESSDKKVVLFDQKKISIYKQGYREACFFALLNRKILIERSFGILKKIYLEKINNILILDRAHNFFSEEEDKYIYHKGVNPNEEGMLNLVLGNMVEGSALFVGTSEYGGICHGAGRSISRKKAIATVNPRFAKDLMIFAPRRALIEEAPECYKPFQEIIKAIEDSNLGKLLGIYTPLLVVKE